MKKTAIRHLPLLPVLGSHLVLITAHPDDESYAFGGLCLENARRGGTNTLICLTDGEKGNSHIKAKFSRTILRQLRQRELNAAARILRIRKIFRCKLPDGKIINYRSVALGRLATIFKAVHCQVVVSFGSDGITGHRDHIQAGRLAAIVARRYHLPILRCVLPTSARSGLKQWLISRLGSRHYIKSARTILPRYRVNFSIRAKQRALRCHRSQMDGPGRYTGYAPFAVKVLASSEYYA